MKKKNSAYLTLGMGFSALLLSACQPSNNPSTESPLGNNQESSQNDSNSAEASVAQVLDVSQDGALTKTRISLPEQAQNAAEHALFIHYLGTGKSLEGNPKQQVPFRTYFDACNLDTDTPSLFVSMTLHDDSSNEIEYPMKGAIFELQFDDTSNSFVPVNNQTIVGMCNESHGIAVSDDCSTVASICATAIEQPVSASFDESFTDLVASSSETSSAIRNIDNVDEINNRNDLSDEQKQQKYKYNGEVWLLEWQNKPLSEAPERFVIHKGYGGHPYGGAIDLIYSEADNSYGTAFATSTFDNNGGRHRSAALMIVERGDENRGWSLNPNDRGWGWACGYGHVFFIRPYWNPYATEDEAPFGKYNALCTSDGNNKNATNAGSIAIEQESSNIFEGYTSYLVPSHNSGVSNGGGHIVLPIDETRSIGVMVGPEMHPFEKEDFAHYLSQTEQDVLDHLGAEQVQEQNLTGLNACNYWEGGSCLFEYMSYVYEGGGRFPLYAWTFWSDSAVRDRDLSKIGIFHVQNQNQVGRYIHKANGRIVKWVAEDPDCMLGAPQLVDLKNGRYLLGYAKFQCMSDEFKLSRFATSTINSRSVATLVPSEYYLMEIDAEGNALTQPTLIRDSGWGGVDKLINFGDGRVAWAYIPSPELQPDGSFPEPRQHEWEVILYDSPLD